MEQWALSAWFDFRERLLWFSIGAWALITLVAAIAPRKQMDKTAWKWHPIGTGFCLFVPHVPFWRRWLLKVLLGSKWIRSRDGA